MVATQPQFLLFCDAHIPRPQNRNAVNLESLPGRWHFLLERLDGTERLEAADSERAQPRDRLSLLAVVRGLEALDQPSLVTLVTTSRYVSRGLRYGLSEWRDADYNWEHFGVQKPIRNADLWQRIDGALKFHKVACRLLESSLSNHDVPEEEPEIAAAIGVHTPEVPEVIQPTTSPIPKKQTYKQPTAQPNWWDLAAGWKQWLKGRGVRPSALAGV